MGEPDLSHLAHGGTEIAVRVTPRARRNAVVAGAGGDLRVLVTCAPEGGRANREAQRLLARALGVAKSRIQLARGAKARDKVFRVAPD